MTLQDTVFILMAGPFILAGWAVAIRVAVWAWRAVRGKQHD